MQLFPVIRGNLCQTTIDSSMEILERPIMLPVQQGRVGIPKKSSRSPLLYGKHYGTFQDFHGAINGCLAKIPTDHREKLHSLMTPNFQTFNPASFLAA